MGAGIFITILCLLRLINGQRLFNNELVQHINTVETSWSAWSQWSECSRSCDGGLSNQRRRCIGDKLSCQEHSVRYKLCNVQACTYTMKQMEDQTCETRNSVPINGRYYRWIPVSRQRYQCFVMCEDETRNIPNVLEVNMADGTRCGRRASHHCIQGKCLKIGCDGYVGSTLRVDGCGICGGDNSSCGLVSNTLNKHVPVIKTRYDWKVRWNACSVSCGTGYESAFVRCTSTQHHLTVPDYRCDESKRPGQETRECFLHPCGPGWRVSSWDACSSPCGGGIRKRKVKCMQDNGRGRTEDVPSYRCPDPIPVSEEACNPHFCPALWDTGIWQPCSVSCGVGVQFRPVFCYKSPMHGVMVNVSNTECRGPKPHSTRSCSRPECFQGVANVPKIVTRNTTLIQIKRTKTIHLQVGEIAKILPRQQVKIICPVRNFDTKLLFWTRNKRLIPISRRNRIFVTSKGALKIKRADPNLDAGIFTCIAGLRSANINIQFSTKRKAQKQGEVIMKSVIKGAKSMLNLEQPQNDKIPGPRAPINKLHNVLDNLKGDHVFSKSEWTTCSRTCGVGAQTRKVSCVKATESYVKVVPDEDCFRHSLKKPVNFRSCSIQSHCPRWTAEQWQECSSKFCKREGMAIQSRNIKCINDNSTVIPNTRCRHLPAPVTKQECTNRQCVAEWHTSGWTKCKPRCGRSGKKMRMLSCIWKDSAKPAQINCRGKARPVVWKRCKPKKCKKRKGCFDESRYCSLVGHLKMCKYSSFEKKCCHTCRNQKNSIT